MQFSAEQLGIWILIALFLLDAAWKWAAHKRAEKGELEPRHTPGIDAKIKSQVDEAERRLQRDIEAHKAKQDDELQRLHGRVSSLRDTTKADFEALSSRMSKDIDGLRAQIAEFSRRQEHNNVQYARELGSLTAAMGDMKSMLHSMQTMLQRHIEAS